MPYALIFLSAIFPLAALAVEPNTDADTIGAEWNNSTSVEFPATSTDAEGNVIYNYYDDSQFFSGGGQTAPPMKEPGPDAKKGELIIDAGSQQTGNGTAKNLFNSFNDAGGVTGSDDSDFDFFGDVVNPGSLWSVTLSGSIIRDELKKQGVKDVVLKGFDPKKSGNDIADWLPKTKGDLSLVAAAAIVHDASIVEVHLTLSKFDIQYLANGRLLYVIPWKYVITVRVDPGANAVSVVYPWYEWFIWKPVSKSELETAIRDAVSEGLATSPEASLDRQARIFASVADVLKMKNEK